MIQALRRLRHGPLRRLEPVWVRLGRAYRGALRGSGLSVQVRQRIGPYGPFRLDGYFSFSDFEHWGRDHNNGFVACVERCRGARCVLDVGAHIGLVTLPMSAVLAPGGTVYAFEPAAANLRYLHRHLALNRIDNVEVAEELVGFPDGEAVRFFERPEVTGMNSVVVRKEPERFVSSRKPQVSIDRFCADRGLAPEVIKIDVEGAEMGVLRGAALTLSRHRPTVFLSVHPAELSLLGHSLEDLRALVRSLAYECYQTDGRPALELRLAEYVLEGAG